MKVSFWQWQRRRVVSRRQLLLQNACVQLEHCWFGRSSVAWSQVQHAISGLVTTGGDASLECGWFDAPLARFDIVLVVFGLRLGLGLSLLRFDGHYSVKCRNVFACSSYSSPLFQSRWKQQKPVFTLPVLFISLTECDPLFNSFETVAATFNLAVACSKDETPCITHQFSIEWKF